MSTGPRPLCADCIHANDGDGMSCTAFPEGIPDEIFFMEFVHTKPFPGDGGILFEKKRGVELPELSPLITES